MWIELGLEALLKDEAAEPAASALREAHALSQHVQRLVKETPPNWGDALYVTTNLERSLTQGLMQLLREEPRPSRSRDEILDWARHHALELDEASQRPVDERLAVEDPNLVVEAAVRRASKVRRKLKKVVKRRAESDREARRGGRISRRLLAGITHNLTLSIGIVRAGVTFLPAAHRPRYKDEWSAELEYLKQEAKPLLGVAARMSLKAPHLALQLQMQLWLLRPRPQWFLRQEPLIRGILTAAATFAAAAAGIWTSNGTPTRWQIILAVIASGLTGILAAWPSRKKRVSPRQRDK